MIYIKKHIISIDFRMHRASGIGTYIRNLLPLVERKGNNYYHYCLLGKTEEMQAYDWTRGNNITLIDCRSPIYSIGEQFELIKNIPKETSLFWSPHYNVPIFYSGKTIVTVHDVFHLAMSQFVEGFHKRAYAKGLYNIVARKASKILCVSNFTRDELIKYTNCKRQKIHVTYNGVANDWFNITKQKHPIDKPFLLYVGNVKPHKNLCRLLDAFKMVHERIPHDLVIVGKSDGFITSDLAVTNKALDLGERVRFTGYVTNAELQQYYVHADTLIFPSLYEGFGLPPLEAMACGCPSLISSVAALPEVCADAALYCDPYNVADIANKIMEVTQNQALRERIKAKGLQQAKLFNWEQCAEKTLATVEEVLRE